MVEIGKNALCIEMYFEAIFSRYTNYAATITDSDWYEVDAETKLFNETKYFKD